jgi:hypothetical protein
MFYHDRIVFLKKDEIIIPFINSYNYRILIVMMWVCQSKVPSSIITNCVSVGHSQASCCRGDHKKEAIVIDYFHYSDA